MRYQIAVARRPLCTLMDVKGDIAGLKDRFPDLIPDLPEKPNTLCLLGDISAYWIGPEHWLIRAPIQQESAYIAVCEEVVGSTQVGALIVSDTLVFIELDGVDAAEVLSIASPLDTHSSVFTDNSVSYTDAFGLKALLIKHRSDKFELALDYSFSHMLSDCLGKITGQDLSILGGISSD